MGGGVIGAHAGLDAGWRSRRGPRGQREWCRALGGAGEGQGTGGKGADLRDRGGAGWVRGVRAGEVGEDGAKHGWVLGKRASRRLLGEDRACAAAPFAADDDDIVVGDQALHARGELREELRGGERLAR